MDKSTLNRLRYLKQNRQYLSESEQHELEHLQELYDHEIESPDQPEVAEKMAESLAASASSPEVSLPKRATVGKRSERSDTDTKPSNKKTVKKTKKIDPETGKKIKKKHHFVRYSLLLLLALLLTMAGFFVYGYQRGVSREGGAAKVENFDGQKTASGAVNILIMGADQRPWQNSGDAHSDSIMILQVGAKDGKVKLVSLMRDTLVSIPNVGPAGAGPNVKINAAYTIGEQNNHQGAELLRQTIEKNFGINCQYYAVVDFSGFATVIDSLFPNGVRIEAKFSTVGGQTLDEVPVPDDLAQTDGNTKQDTILTADEATNYGYGNSPGVYEMIKQGWQTMNGRTLLNYARFRHDDQGDYGRVQRQQQVMSTVMSKLKNPLTLFTGSSALGTARAVVTSNIPNSFFLTHGFSLGLDLGKGITTYTVPQENDYQAAYDIYGGSGLLIDMNKYKAKLQEILGN